MTYIYKCTDENCKLFDIEVQIEKKISESDRKESCEFCGKELQRVYKPSGIKTSDGFKS